MYYFIVNLTSRTGKAAKTWHQLKLELDQREVAYKAYVSEYPGHATRLAKMICNKADKDIRLIVVGGMVRQMKSSTAWSILKKSRLAISHPVPEMT